MMHDMTFPGRAVTATLAVSLFALTPVAAWALGLGKPSTRAVLGEPLRLSVPMRLEPGEQVANDCVSAEVYFGDDKLSGTAVSALVLPVSGSAAEAARAHARTLLIRTTALINEPVVTVYLSAGCQARITRKFIALADPPADAAPMSAAALDLPLAAQEGGSLTESWLGQQERQPGGGAGTAGSGQSAAQTASRAAGKARAKAGSHVASPSRRTVASQETLAESGPEAALPREVGRHARTDKSSVRQAKTASAAVRLPVSRLQVDPVEADALVSPELRASVDMNPAQGDGAELQARRDAAAALWRAMNTTPEQQLREQQRLQELEKRLTQLHAEGTQTRQNVSLLQGRMRELESERTSFGLYVLGGLALAGLGAAFHFYTRLRRQERQRDAWWPPHSGAVPLSVPRAGEVDTASPAESHDAHPVVPAAVAALSSGDAALAPVPEQDAAQPGTAPLGAPVLAASAAPVAAPAVPLADWGVAPPSFAPPHDPSAIEQLRAVSVEELIDLEQQAEFFVVLGQDEAAIGLLEAHVQGTDGTIPLPFLKLLELYQRLGRRADYERVQAAFNAHFNAHAPTWESDLQHGQSLEDYPGVIERLQALWAVPARAMEVLEKSLIRPDAEAETFDLPAYRQLLFLYAVARDLADKPDADHEPPVTSVTPLTATRPFIADPDVRPTLDVDLCLDELAQSPAGPAATASSTATPSPAGFTSNGLPSRDARGEGHPHAPSSDYLP